MFIYKITSPNTESVYVGKTTNTIKRRFSSHRADLKRYARGFPKYCSSFKVLECGNAVIELIEETDDNSREAHWIKELNACNQFKMTIDWSDPVSVSKYKREHRAANIDTRNEQAVKYREANRERRNEKVGCDNCGKMVCRGNISTHKKTKKCINNPLQINSL